VTGSSPFFNQLLGPYVHGTHIPAVGHIRMPFSSPRFLVLFSEADIALNLISSMFRDRARLDPDAVPLETSHQSSMPFSS
jgi:hypothetical protein